jgi:ketosteroid isomerase-like protein
MGENLDTLKQGYEDFNKGDIEAASRPWADDIVWQGSDSEDLPGGGTHEGKDAFLKVLQQAVGGWDEFNLSADEFFEDGDSIVVLAHNKVRKGDQSAELPVVHIWRFENGEVRRLQLLTDTYHAAQLLGKA